MAQSAVDCCNGALQKVGETPIMSLSDDLPQARRCALAYDGCRRSELRKHRWNFAIKRASLAPDADAPAFDYAYQFTLPVDCLRVLFPTDATNDWVVEGRKILTNAGAVLNLRYVYDATDPTRWDALFYELMSVSIALQIMESTTGSNSKKDRLDAEYKGLLAEAKKINAIEQVPMESPEDGYWTARL